MIDAIWFHLKSFLNRSFFTNRKGRIKRYGVPVLFALLVLLAKSLLLLFYNQDFSLHLIFIGVIFSAWYGGFGPGILAAFLIGILNEYLFFAPQFAFDFHSLISISIFILEGVLVSIIAEAKRQSDMQRDEFLGFASHELKNPLAAIKGFAALLKRKLKQSKDPQLAHMAQRIDEQANRATMLINELLDITKIDANKLQLDIKRFSIYSFIKETVDEQKIISQTHKITLSGKTKKKVSGDQYRLKQVFVNLLTNAIKYSPDADTVKVTVQNIQQGVIVGVQDFGVGIGRKNIEKIFDRFYRTESAEKGNIQGLGLGLYISSQIIKKHGGKIWVESEKGKGSTFYVILPTRS